LHPTHVCQIINSNSNFHVEIKYSSRFSIFLHKFCFFKKQFNMKNYHGWFEATNKRLMGQNMWNTNERVALKKCEKEFNELFNIKMWYQLIPWSVNNYLLKYTPFKSNYNFGIIVKAQKEAFEVFF